jgi:dienelactone hydrolase
MLVLDYLHARQDVDTTRVEAVGISLGAPFVTIAGALDKRFARVWALHGSGGSYAPLEASMRQSISFAPLRALAAGVATAIIAGPRLAPERWAGDIAPRPFIMVNASSDERLPATAIHALYQSAGHPKEMIWTSGGHIHGDQATIQRLTAIVAKRMTSAQ